MFYRILLIAAAVVLGCAGFIIMLGVGADLFSNRIDTTQFRSPAFLEAFSLSVVAAILVMICRFATKDFLRVIVMALPYLAGAITIGVAESQDPYGLQPLTIMLGLYVPPLMHLGLMIGLLDGAFGLVKSAFQKQFV